MAKKKVKTSLQAALSENITTKMSPELESDLRELFATQHGDELVAAVIARVQRYAVEESGRSVDMDFGRADAYTLEVIQKTISKELSGWVSRFISDTHREFIVRCHARGLSTTDAVWELMKEDRTMNRLAQKDAVGAKALQEMLLPRLAYLKPGTARWPEKKYGAVWREEREQYRQTVRDMPLTSPVEQAALLARHVARINYVLENSNYNVKDLQALTASLVKTLESLQKVSAVEERAAANLSGAQLVAVLERLTLALDAPEQLALSGDAGALVAVLEHLALALKSPERKAIASADTKGDGDNP